MITGRLVISLGVSQLICWGISFYLIGVFGDLIVADLGWRRSVVYGGFSFALLTMGVASPMVGRLIDRFGGGRVMAGGSVLCALGCMVLSFAQTLPVYYGAWALLGLAMRSILYDAAFAALARIGGTAARRPMAQVTLFGGLAATCFWPIGHLLAEPLGWRGAVLAYAGFALLTLPLHLAIPSGPPRAAKPTIAIPATAPLAAGGRDRVVAAGLYAVIVTLTNALNAGMAAHMIGMLVELGLAATMAVSIASLRGVGQSTARLAEILFGARVHPISLNLAATVLLPLCFAVGLASGGYLAAAAAFTFFYGVSNGILSITRGTVPLVLFDVTTYGTYVGKLLAPSFIVAAGSPLAFAAVIEHAGAQGVLFLSIGLSAVVLAAALILRIRFADHRAGGPRSQSEVGG